MKRPRVTDVDSQFNVTNNSHHGVKGARYSGRTRNAAGPRTIKSASTFANNSSALLQGIRSTIYDAGNFNALYVPLGTDGTAATGLGDDSTIHCGDCHTVGQWKPQATTNINGVLNTAVIGAHGSNNEYMLRNSIGTDERHVQRAYSVVSGMNVTWTNPSGPLMVSYNCHNINNYGKYAATGTNGAQPAGSEMGNDMAHVGEYAEGGRCNAQGNTLPFGGYTTGKATDGTQFSGTNNKRIFGKAGVNSPGSATATPAYAGEQNGQYGNIFGIQCLNCHNSGYGNAYGGLHGSANNTSWTDAAGTLHDPAVIAPALSGGLYIDGAGHVNKVERFLPGLGDAMHVPGTLGGVNGGTGNFVIGGNAISNDTNWEQKQWKTVDTTMNVNYKTGVVSGTQTAVGAGCYTLSSSTSIATNVTAGLKGPSVTGPNGAASAPYGTWGGCDDHSAAQGAGNHGFLKRIVRPVTY
jgi:hypothetical protein